ncbi:hypothetical protein DPM13_03610 [Paracoccus mutanolyticus]|uniref:Uncharacterized protein n=1 Tax=Paracoccus mutanolyticus TaxID=1499308 RepID=A0ABM6WPU3_9RHOB|nr:hypothetical protein [Paracoccus mutanolyticus]AWX92608.1 hypothetical protein DPM13_03610 [Paracoccus mutanolyticus]
MRLAGQTWLSPAPLGLSAARLRGTGARYSTESAHAKLFADGDAWTPWPGHHRQHRPDAGHS